MGWEIDRIERSLWTLRGCARSHHRQRLCGGSRSKGTSRNQAAAQKDAAPITPARAGSDRAKATSPTMAPAAPAAAPASR